MSKPINSRRAVLAVGVLSLAMAVLFVGVTSASAAVPARPKAKAPVGAITTSMLTFEWSKPARAKTYDIRVYEVRRSGRLLLFKSRNRYRQTSWTIQMSSQYPLKWKVRGRNASGAGPWSRMRNFRIDSSLWAEWMTWDYRVFFWFKDDGTYERAVRDSGILRERGTWTTATTSADAESITGSIKLTNRLESWEPAADDPSGIPAYTDNPLPAITCPYALDDKWIEDFDSLTITDVDGFQRVFSRDGPTTD